MSHLLHLEVGDYNIFHAMAKEQEVIGNVYERVVINVFFLRISGYYRTTCTIYNQIMLYEEIKLEK